MASRSPSPPSPSPSPPRDYPSPPSSNASDKENVPVSRGAQREAPDCDAPPAKKQKTMKTRELKTEHLDLQKLIESDDGDLHKAQDAKLARLMEVLRTKKKIVVIAGAGISVSAGSTWSFCLLGMSSTNYLDSPGFPFFERLVRNIAHPTQVEGFRKALVRRIRLSKRLFHKLLPYDGSRIGPSDAEREAYTLPSHACDTC